MNRLARWVMRLYPARWRRRYGDEVDALLADTGADARAVTNLAAGGVRMQFSTWSFPKLALVLGLAGTLAGLGASFLITPSYISHATLLMTPQSSDGDFQQLETLVFSRASLARIINITNDPGLRLYTDELKVTPLEDVIEEMHSNITIQIVTLPGKLETTSSAFNISFQYPDALKAQRALSAITARFIEQNAQRASGSRFQNVLEVIDTASLPVSPIFPNVVLVRMAGFALGALLVWIVRRIRKAKFVGWRYATATLIFGLSGMVAAELAYLSDLLGDQYLSSAVLRLRSSTEQAELLQHEVLSRTSLSTVINDPRLRLYQSQLKTTPLEDVIQDMLRHIGLTTIARGAYTDFYLSFNYSDRYKAQQTVTALVSRLMEANMRRNVGAIQNPPSPEIPGRLELLDPASRPVNPVKPNRYVMTTMGFFAGLIAAAVTALIRRRWKPEPELPVDVASA